MQPIRAAFVHLASLKKVPNAPLAVIQAAKPAKDPRNIARAAMTGTYFQARLACTFRRGSTRSYAGVPAGLAKGKARGTAQAVMRLQ
jgi:hypothetical protein